MSEKITIPAVAYQAMERERNVAWNRMVKLRESLDETVLAKKVKAASAEVDRLQAQLDRFAPEEQKDARSEESTATTAPPPDNSTLAGSGGAREPATDHAGPPTPRATDDDDMMPPEFMRRGT